MSRFCSLKIRNKRFKLSIKKKKIRKHCCIFFNVSATRPQLCQNQWAVFYKPRLDHFSATKLAWFLAVWFHEGVMFVWFYTVTIRFEKFALRHRKWISAFYWFYAFLHTKAVCWLTVALAVLPLESIFRALGGHVTLLVAVVHPVVQ